MVLLHWRKPDLVPLWMKQARRERMKDVLVMVYALKISAAVKYISGTKLMALARPILGEQQTCRDWRQNDTHAQRRSDLVQGKRRAHKQKFGLGNPFLPPSKMIKLDMVRVVETPCKAHNDLVLSEFGKTEISPKHGIEVFRKHAQSQLVLIRFLDPRYSKFGQMLVDFTKLTWLGWADNAEGADCFLEPQRFDLHRRTRWMGMDLVMSGGIEEVPKPAEGSEEHVLIGNLLDIQSCVEHDDDDGVQTNTSLVRLNIGEYGVAMKFGAKAHFSKNTAGIMEGIKNTLGEDVYAKSLTDCPDKGRRLPVFFEGVAEVVGYVDKTSIPQHLMPVEFQVCYFACTSTRVLCNDRY